MSLLSFAKKRYSDSAKNLADFSSRTFDQVNRWDDGRNFNQRETNTAIKNRQTSFDNAMKPLRNSAIDRLNTQRTNNTLPSSNPFTKQTETPQESYSRRMKEILDTKTIDNNPRSRGFLEQSVKPLVGGIVDQGLRIPSNVGSLIGTGLQDPGGAAIRGISSLNPVNYGIKAFNAVSPWDVANPYKFVEDKLANVASRVTNAVTPNVIDDNRNKLGSGIENVSKRYDKNVKEMIAGSDYQTTARPGENNVVVNLSTGTGSLATSLLLAKGTGSSTVPSAIFGINAGGEQTRQAREAGKSASESFNIGVQAGVFEAALEKIGLDKFIGNMGTGNIIKKTLVNSLVEGSQETMQSLAQSGVTTQYQNVDWKQAITEAFIEGAYGAVLGGGTTAITTSVNNLVDKGIPPDIANQIVNKVIDTYKSTAPTKQVQLSDNELFTLTDYSDVLNGLNKEEGDGMRRNQVTTLARQIGEKVGLDVITGSPQEIQKRIADFVDQQRAMQSGEGGFISADPNESETVRAAKTAVKLAKGKPKVDLKITRDEGVSIIQNEISKMQEEMVDASPDQQTILGNRLAKINGTLLTGTDAEIQQLGAQLQTFNNVLSGKSGKEVDPELQSLIDQAPVENNQTNNPTVEIKGGNQSVIDSINNKPKVTLKEEVVTSKEMSDRYKAMQEAGMSPEEIDNELSNLEVDNTIPGLTEGDFINTYNNVDVDKLTPEQSDTVRQSLKDSADQSVDTLVNAIEETSGDSFENFARAVQDNSRNGTPIPDNMVQAKQIWDNAISDLRNKGVIPDTVGDVAKDGKSWMHQERVGSGELDNNGEISLVSELDKSVEAYQERTNSVGLDEMDYSVDASIRKTLYQIINDKFKRQDRANQLVQKQAEQGIEIDQEQALNALDKQTEVVNEIKDAAENGGLLTSDTEKMDLLTKLNEVGKEKGTQQVTYKKGLSWVGRMVQSSSELYHRYTAEIDGKIVNLSKLMGFEKYLASGAIGIQQNSEVNGATDVTEYMQNELKDAAIDQSVKDQIINGLNKTLQTIQRKAGDVQMRLDKAIESGNQDDVKYYEKELYKYTDESSVTQQRERAFESANRKIAREIATNFAETFIIEDKQLAKSINHDLKRMLTMDATEKSIAATLTRGAATLGYWGALGYNVLSAFQNVTELKRTWAKYTTKEFGQAVKMAFTDPDIVRRYNFKNSDYSNPDNEMGGRTKTKWYAPMGMFDSTESFKDAVQLHATEARYKSQGYTGTELTEKVYHEALKWALKYGQGGSLGYSKSKTGTILGQFSQYAVKETKLLLDQANRATFKDDVSAEEKRSAQKYVAKMAVANTTLYVILSAILGSTWEYVFGVIDPLGKTYTDKDAGTDEQVIAKIPGGPAVSLLKNLYLAVREEHRNADTEQRPTSYSKDSLITNDVKKSVATLIPGGNQFINKSGGFITDQMQGYNEGSDGRARFSQAEGNFDKTRGILFGRYSTNNAREYFGSQGAATDAPIVGKFFAQNRQSPVSARVQEKVDEVKGTSWNDKLLGQPVTVKDKEEIKRLIGVSREMTNEKKTLRENNPQAYSAVEASTGYKELDNGTFESDVISPDKWDAIGSDKSGKAFEYMRDKVKTNAKEFGDEVDPIYNLTDKNKINQLLAMRSLPTGDDREMKARLRTEDWYKQFEKDLGAYYDKLNTKSFDGNDMFKKTDRAQEYYKLSTEYPEQTSLRQKYLDMRYGNEDKGIAANEEAGKAFFKANADQLLADRQAASDAALAWTNKMRKIEGADPLSKEVWENATFGYNDDEESVASIIASKYGGYYNKGGSSSGSGTKSAGTYAVNTKVSGASNPKVSVKAPKIGKYKVAGINAGSKPKVSMKKSLV